MNKITDNVNNQNFNISKNGIVEKTKINKEPNKNINPNIKYNDTNDTITINQKNENIINTKKSYDAFKDTCKDVGYIKNSLGTNVDMSYYYVIAVSLMKTEGILTPSFNFNENNNDFLPFIDNLKDFAKNVNITNPGFFPSQFLDFCDVFKEKLIQYDCK